MRCGMPYGGGARQQVRHARELARDGAQIRRREAMRMWLWEQSIGLWSTGGGGEPTADERVGDER
eukprot:1191210-Prymnesium_polylepis.1